MFDTALFISVGVASFIAGVIVRPFIGGRPSRQGIETWIHGHHVTIPSFAMGTIVNRIMTPEERKTLQKSAADNAPQWVIDDANAAWERAALHWLTHPEFGLRWAENNIADDVLEALIALADEG